MIYCAHSGFNATPDNSLDSLREGAKAGFPLAEIDIRLTADGRVVLHHDDTVETPGGTLRISETAWDVLHAQKPGIVPLEEALCLARELGISVNLDLKSKEAAAPAAAMCAALGIAGVCHFSGLEPGAAKTHAALCLPVRHMLNVPLALALMPGRAVEAALDTRAFGLNLHYRMISPQLVALAHRSFLWVWAWTVNDEQVCRDLTAMGVNGITTRVAAIGRV